MAKGKRLRGDPQGFEPTQVKEGEHVYVSPPWPLRDGEPYMIARVMEAPRAEQANGSSSKASADASLRVRVAYFLRPRDISNRYVADFRTLTATMHSDTVPVSFLRGYCTVRHRDEIEFIETYKREPECFYWHQYYDRYLHRYFDTMATDKIKNAPAEVLQYLQTNFEWVLCEVGTAQRLCDPQRGCCICKKWAADNESVNCALCSKVFHLTCLDPPLSQKPRAGYSWSCAPCSKAYEEQVEEYMEKGYAPAKRQPPPVASATAPQMATSRSTGRSKEATPARAAGQPLRNVGGWPFRYFGNHTDVMAVLDPHDSLYPRASTRLGNRFQASVGAWDDERGCQIEVAPIVPAVRKTKHPSKGKAADKAAKADNAVIDRGEDSAIRVDVTPVSERQEPLYDELVDDVKELPVTSQVGVDAIHRAVRQAYSTDDFEEARAQIAEAKVEDFGFARWTEEELSALKEGAALHGNDIEEIAKDIPTKKYADVVRRYYMFIGYSNQDDGPVVLEDKVAAAASQQAKTGAVADDTASLYSGAPPKSKPCATCDTKESPAWFKCSPGLGEKPKGGKAHLQCEECGLRWRHYAQLWPPIEDPKTLRRTKREMAEQEKITGASGAPVASTSKKTEVTGKKEKAKEPTPEPTPPPPEPPKPVVPLKPCVMCKRLEPKTAMLTCDSCSMMVHTSCYGVEGTGDRDDWRCDPCALARDKKLHHADPRCVMCPRPSLPSDPDKFRQALEAPITALDCLKETELKNFVHLVCAVWHNEVKFSDPVRMQRVEGVSAVPAKRWQQTCFVCQQGSAGACVKCEDCSHVFHVSCAWQAGFKFGFEIKPLKKRRQTQVTSSIKFKKEEGVMQACIWCKDHHFTKDQRVTYDLGAKDPASKLSALQTFVQVNMKPAPPLAVGNTPTFELLRHARRVEQVAAPVLRPPTPPPEPTPAPIQQAAAASKSGSPAHAKGAAGPSGSRASLSSPPNARKRKRTDADMGAIAEADDDEGSSAPKKSNRLRKPRVIEDLGAEAEKPKRRKRKSSLAPTGSPALKRTNEEGAATASTAAGPTSSQAFMAAARAPSVHAASSQSSLSRATPTQRLKSSKLASSTQAQSSGPAPAQPAARSRGEQKDGSIVSALEQIGAFLSARSDAPEQAATSAEAGLAAAGGSGASAAVPPGQIDFAALERILQNAPSPDLHVESATGSPAPTGTSHGPEAKDKRADAAMHSSLSELLAAAAPGASKWTNGVPSTDSPAQEAYDEDHDMLDDDFDEDEPDDGALAQDDFMYGSTSRGRGRGRGGPAASRGRGGAGASGSRARAGDSTDGSPAGPKPQRKRRAPPSGACSNCGTADSNIWRAGPNGHLCNACGLYFKTKGEHRPTHLINRAIGTNRLAKKNAGEERSSSPSKPKKSKASKTSGSQAPAHTGQPFGPYANGGFSSFGHLPLASSASGANEWRDPYRMPDMPVDSTSSLPLYAGPSDSMPFALPPHSSHEVSPSGAGGAPSGHGQSTVSDIAVEEDDSARSFGSYDLPSLPSGLPSSSAYSLPLHSSNAGGDRGPSPTSTNVPPAPRFPLATAAGSHLKPQPFQINVPQVKSYGANAPVFPRGLTFDSAARHTSSKPTAAPATQLDAAQRAEQSPAHKPEQHPRPVGPSYLDPSLQT